MIRDLLIEDEGLRLKPYRCKAGKLSIGVGRNLEDVGITKEEALYLLDNDIRRVTAEAVAVFPWFPDLDEARQVVVLSMIFNLGLAGFMKFKKTIAAIERRDWEKAAVEMLDSKWATQVGTRAWDLAHMMKTGKMKGT